MNLRRLVTTVALTGLISSFAPAAFAAPAPTKKIVDGIFDISALDADHQLLVEEALACDDFDWSKLKKTLKHQTGRSVIKVEIKDLSKWGAVGASWSTGVLQLEKTVTDPHWFQQIFMHEVGHMVDFFYLMPNKLHGTVAKIYGAPWKTMGHDFNGGFTSAFSCLDGGDGNGRLDDTKVQAIRTLLGGAGLVPAKTL
jgi:hypothetical protein